MISGGVEAACIKARMEVRCRASMSIGQQSSWWVILRSYAFLIKGLLQASIEEFGPQLPHCQASEGSEDVLTASPTRSYMGSGD